MLTFYDCFPALTLAEIEAFEIEIGFRLPEDYRAFLKDHNGCRPRPCSFTYYDLGNGRVERIGGINKFFGITDKQDRYSIHRDLKRFDRYVKSGLLPIADEGGGNYILLALSGEHRGKVYYWDHEIDSSDGNLFFIAASFGELLNKLFEYVDMAYLIIFEEDAAFRLDVEYFKRLLAQRWSTIRFDDPGSFLLSWVNNQMQMGGLHADQQTVSIDDTKQGVAEFAVWYRSIVPPEYSLYLCHDQSPTEVIIAPDDTAADILSKIDTME